MSRDELVELWENHGFEPARELVADQVVRDFENHTALQEFNLKINLAYMAAMSQGMPESFARKLAKIHPETLFDVLAPLASAGEITYRMTVGDLIDAVKDDPWSLRALGEIAMVVGPGKLAKLRNLDNVVDTIDTTRDARSAVNGALLKEHLRQLDRYGDDGFRVLDNGKLRYYGDVASAKNPGEMIGRRVVREWDPATGATRTWHETIDNAGNVRIVRPEQGPVKTHYHFDEHGNYEGRR